MENYQLLEQLCLARGVAGQEGAVRRIIREAIAGYVDTLEVDALGNLIARKYPKSDPSSPLRVMIAAHMDEVGFMVIKVNDNGAVKFRSVGGIDARILPGKRVRIGEKAIPGVILQKPTHLQSKGDRNGVTEIDSLVIDTGRANGIQPGDLITFEPVYGEVGRLLKGKAFDDRAGCFVLAELLAHDYPCEVVGVFTVQEEIGLRGARVAAYAVKPHVGFALEGTIADDLPKEKDESPTTQLGKGPALSMMDRSAFADRRLVQHLIRTAEGNGIPWQFKQPGVGGTDIGAIHLVHEGVPSLAVSVPCRYIHAPAALLDPNDLVHTIALMRKALATLPDIWPIDEG
jgi:endoglucanase